MVIPPTKFSKNSDVPTKGSVPHIGVAYLAAYLREKNIEINVIDSPIEKLEFKEIQRRVKRFKPDVLGLTANTIQILEANETAKKIKGMDKDLPIIICGYHATAMPVKTLQEFNYFDYLVYGE